LIKNITLLDYEVLTNEHGARVIFGKLWNGGEITDCGRTANERANFELPA
jgi:hypothetical protein